MTEKKIKNIFVEGAVKPLFISESIQKHNTQHSIGAHSIFLGQVRADDKDGKKVIAIEYTANQEMALNTMYEIREELFNKYSITCMHVYHSLGKVIAGEICLFVFTSAPHRKAAIDACGEAVEKIKKSLPVWGKELLEDETHQWKINS